MEMLGENQLTEKDANDVIMKAREHWFAEEEAQAEAALEEAEKANEKEETV